MADVMKAKKPIFAALAADQPGQLAQLIALEHTVTGNDKTCHKSNLHVFPLFW
jgi:hypothetical protein